MRKSSPWPPCPWGFLGLWNLILDEMPLRFSSRFDYTFPIANNVRLQNGKITDWFDSRPWTFNFGHFLRLAAQLAFSWSLCTKVRPAFQGERISLKWGYVPKNLGAPMMVFCSYPEGFERMRGNLKGPHAWDLPTFHGFHFGPGRRFVAESVRKSVDHFTVKPFNVRIKTWYYPLEIEHNDGHVVTLNRSIIYTKSINGICSMLY